MQTLYTTIIIIIIITLSFVVVSLSSSSFVLSSSVVGVHSHGRRFAPQCFVRARDMFASPTDFYAHKHSCKTCVRCHRSVIFAYINLIVLARICASENHSRQLQQLRQLLFHIPTQFRRWDGRVFLCVWVFPRSRSLYEVVGLLLRLIRAYTGLCTTMPLLTTAVAAKADMRTCKQRPNEHTQSPNTYIIIYSIRYVCLNNNGSVGGRIGQGVAIPGVFGRLQLLLDKTAHIIAEQRAILCAVLSFAVGRRGRIISDHIRSYRRERPNNVLVKYMNWCDNSGTDTEHTVGGSIVHSFGSRFRQH